MKLIHSFFGVFIICLCFSFYGCLRCLDENGENLDWFVIYKLPKRNNENQYINKGLAYAYMTSNDFSNWKFSNHGIDESESMLVKSLQPFYYRKKELTYILYNDQPPYGAKNENKGHAKGVILLDEKSGFWLVHSVPHFPPFETFSYPETGTRYGQSILCVSMNLTNLDKAGLLLQYNEPKIYGAQLKAEIKQYLPNLWKAANNITIHTAPYYHWENISSINNTEFISFAKTKTFSKELYTDLVAPALKTNLLVETWPNEGDRLRSNCSHRFKVKNVKSINMEDFQCNFTTTEDHSKWAVSEGTTGDWICIGDINRAGHQMMRGGGTVCQQNNILSKNFQNIIDTIENC